MWFHIVDEQIVGQSIEKQSVAERHEYHRPPNVRLHVVAGVQQKQAAQENRRNGRYQKHGADSPRQCDALLTGIAKKLHRIVDTQQQTACENQPPRLIIYFELRFASVDKRKQNGEGKHGECAHKACASDQIVSYAGR